MKIKSIIFWLLFKKLHYGWGRWIKKNEDKCDNIDEKENGIDDMQDLIIDPRLHENWGNF